MQIMLRRTRCRKGTTLVEMAVVLPVFFMFLFSLFEFAHVHMVRNILRAAANKAAREGVVDGVTTAQVEQQVMEFLQSGIKNADSVTVLIKDAGVFDDSSSDPSGINYSNLPDIDLSKAESRQLFIVRVEVDYDKVSLLPPMWVGSLRLAAHAVMRHE
ncbi:MAG: pilus assembly protein [Planctomycetota bacterium]|nr:pilus assembly protein [Planctomycetota bacterium]